MGGLLWNASVKSYGYCMTLATLPYNTTHSISAADVGAHLISVGILSAFDILVELRLEFRGKGAGSYSLNMTSPSPPARKFTTSGEFTVGTWTCHNLQYVPDAFVVDYMNISYVTEATTLAYMVADFLYTRNSLNVQRRIT